MLKMVDIVEQDKGMKFDWQIKEWKMPTWKIAENYSAKKSNTRKFLQWKIIALQNEEVENDTTQKLVDGNIISIIY